jgi:hypothetical protein
VSRRAPAPDTRQSLLLMNMGMSDWLENIAGDDDITDEYHCSPEQLLERREDEEGDPIKPET